MLFGNMRILVPKDKLFAYLEGRGFYFSTRHPWLPQASIFGFLYNEIVPLSKEIKTNMRRSCTHLFAAYHLLRWWLDYKPTIEEWIAFWFRGPVEYQAPMKPDRRSRVPLPTDISLNTEIRGWNESHAVFDELGVLRGKHIEVKHGRRSSILPFFSNTCEHV